MNRPRKDIAPKAKPLKCDLSGCKTRFRPIQAHQRFCSAHCRWQAFDQRRQQKIRDEVLAEIKKSVKSMEEIT